MARTEIAPVPVVTDDLTGVAASATTVDASLVTAGASMTPVESAEGLFLYVRNDHATLDKTLTVKAASGYPDGQSAGVGDLVVTVPHAADNGDAQLIALGDTARYKQLPEEAIFLDFESGFTGVIAACTVGG